MINDVQYIIEIFHDEELTNTEKNLLVSLHFMSVDDQISINCLLETLCGENTIWSYSVIFRTLLSLENKGDIIILDTGSVRITKR